MQPRTSQKNLKKSLGFIVEGKTDAVFIESLIASSFKDRCDALIISMSGKAAIASSSKIVINHFLSRDITDIFILFDTDEEVVDEQIKYIEEPIKKMGFEKYVTLIPIQPSIEAWLAASGIDESNGISKSDYKHLNFNKMKSNLDFANFFEAIEAKIK
jgi:hypothetical protein